jgi:hypothetical protein
VKDEPALIKNLQRERLWTALARALLVRQGVRLSTSLLRHPFDTCGQVPLLEAPLPRSAHRRVVGL